MRSTNSNCNCCGNTRRHRRAVWEQCLNFRRPSCPVITMNNNNVLAPQAAQHSKRMVNSKIIRHGKNTSTARWRKVNWRKFQIQQETAQFQKKIVAKSSNNVTGRVFRNARVINVAPTPENRCGRYSNIPGESNIPETVISCCPKNEASDLTWEQIAAMPFSSNTTESVDTYLGEEPISCKYYPVNINDPDKGTKTISLLQNDNELGNYLSEYL